LYQDSTHLINCEIYAAQGLEAQINVYTSGGQQQLSHLVIDEFLVPSTLIVFIQKLDLDQLGFEI
jgi:hypothetical protein